MLGYELKEDEIQDVVEVFKKSRHSITTPIPPKREYQLYIKDSFKKVGVLSSGGIGLIIGTSGVRKTAFMYTCLASLLREDRQYLNVHSKYNENKSVIYINTELAGDDLYYRERDFYKMMGHSTDNDHPRYYSLNYDQFASAEEKFSVFVKTMEAIKAGYLDINVGCICIDSIADLCTSSESEAEAREIFGYIKKFANEMNLFFLLTLHTSRDPNSDAGRGNFGTIAQQKATAVIKARIDKGEDVSEISCTKIRNSKKFAPFHFWHNENGDLEVDVNVEPRPIPTY